MTEQDGHLNKYKEFYKSGLIPSINKLRLEHFVFFVRLEGWDAGELKSLRGIEAIGNPITSENFEQEFEKLKEKELLHKDKVYQHFIK